MIEPYMDRVLRNQQSHNWQVSQSMFLNGIPGGLAGRKVLDFGCGPGRLCDMMACHGANVTGYDIRPEMAERARHTYSHVHFATGPVLEDWGHRYDVVTATHAISHIEDLQDALSRISKVLFNGGILAVLNWNKWNSLYRLIPNLLKGYKGDPTIYQHISKGELDRMLRQHGLQPVSFFRCGERWGIGPDWLCYALFAAYYRKAPPA